MKKEDNQSGFIDLKESEQCTHHEHYPPSHMVIPAGKAYKHVCPQCGNTMIIKSSQPMYKG